MMLFRSQHKTPAPYLSAGTTHPGNRRPCNEDAVMSREEAGLWAVADGMGGHDAGDEASGTLIRCLSEVQPETDFEQAVTGQTRS